MELYTLQLTSQHMQKTNYPPPPKKDPPCWSAHAGRRDSALPQSALPPFLLILDFELLGKTCARWGTCTFFFPPRKACWELLKMAPTATSPGPPRWAALRAVARHLFSTVTPKPTPLHISPLALCFYSQRCLWAQRGSELLSTNIPLAASAAAPCG